MYIYDLISNVPFRTINNTNKINSFNAEFDRRYSFTQIDAQMIHE